MIELKEVFNIKKIHIKQKKRNVCAYARVSTSSDIQLVSFDAQVTTYTNEIMSHPDWNFVGVYADEGKSGTNTSKRTQFNLMVEACHNGLVDLIITKSISRFARNTVDCLKTIQDLKRTNVEVFFEKENISSFDPKIEFIISILSGMAEEESRSISENVKWGNTKRFENGDFHMVTKHFLGYDRDESGHVIINEQEASVVRKIYEMFLDGNGATPIMDYLESKNIKTSTGNKYWNKTAIYGILKNEKYTGNALLQKTYRPSFKSKRAVKNKGELPQFYVVDSHPAIIPLVTFNKVQALRKQKSIKYHKSNVRSLEEVYGNKETPYSGFVKCPHCGKNFNLKVNKNSDTFASKFLQCTSNVSKKKCVSDTLSCQVIDQEILNQINIIIGNKEYFINSLSLALNSDIRVVEARQELKRAEANLLALESKLHEVKEENLNSFHKAVSDKLKEEITILKLRIFELKNNLMTELNVENFLLSIKSTLHQYPHQITAIDEFPYKNFFSKLMVQSRGRIIFCLGMRSDFENMNLTQELSLPGEVSYFIRKTKFTAHHGILFF